MNVPLVRNAYSDRYRSHPTVTPDLPSMTKQSFTNETDINKIMARFFKTGNITHLNSNEPNYGFASALDFRESLEIIQTAQEGFQALPSDIRRQFDNDPQGFLDFVHDDENTDALAEMGLLNDEATEAWESRVDDEQDRLDRSQAAPAAPPAPLEPE